MIVQGAAAFFHGLTGGGVADTIDEYMSASVPQHFNWIVRSMGHNDDGFWVLMVRMDNRPEF